MKYFSKKRFTMRQVVGLLTVVFLGISVIAYAVTIPNTFSSGTTISSGQVNANFTALKTAVDTLETIATGSVILSGSTTNTTPTQLDSFTVNVPGPGTLIVQISGQYFINADAAASESLTVWGNLGLCDTTASSAACGNTYQLMYLQDAEDASPISINVTPFFTLTRIIPIASAGARIFYINGEAPSGYSLTLIGDTKAVAIFLPSTTQLVVTSP